MARDANVTRGAWCAALGILPGFDFDFGFFFYRFIG
jgi:hypothetical protein